MSSIYRKGRDGYFYYQKYLVNPKTGKADKKVFHSLGTKDEVEAKKKQKEYDLKYESQKIKKYNYKSIFFLAVPVLVTFGYFIFQSTDLKNEKNMQIYKEDVFYESESSKKVDKHAVDSENILIEGPGVQKTPVPDPSSDLIIIEELNDIITEREILSDIEMKIIRKETLLDNFSQIKIYGTVKPGYESDQYLTLCKNTALSFKNYSSVIICLYANNVDGVEKALEVQEYRSTDIIKRSWMIFYSYNPVEGEYFDNNPNGYLGFNPVKENEVR